MSRQSAPKKNRALPPALIDPGQRRLPPLLRSAWFGLNQTFRRRIAHLGLTPNQFTALRWLDEHEPAGLTQRELADLMASDANTIVALLRRMERAGWVSSRVDRQDRRRHCIRIGAPGRQLLDQARPIALHLQAQVLAELPAEHHPLLLDLLARLATICHQLNTPRNPVDSTRKD